LLSESSDNLTDYSSETSSFKKFDTKYPKFVKSKSFIAKKTFSEHIRNVVNEELNEDENDEKKVKIPKKKYEYDVGTDNLDLAIRKFQKLKIHKSFREGKQIMDTLYEVKEEAENTVEKNLMTKLQSPQMKFITDNVEDTTCRTSFFDPGRVASFKIDLYEQGEVIKEDNEDMMGNVVEIKKSSSNKKLETLIDKTEAFDDQVNIKKGITEDIETIKEENAEEEDKEDLTASSNFNKSCELPISDELGSNESCKRNFRIAMKQSANLEEIKTIKEDDEF